MDFHSWRGCTDEIVAEWHAAAWRYREVFNEQSFALYEINLYWRILAIAQPRSILQWQFTADYSVLGGIFNDSSRPRPTRRFWNLKQLASTPPRASSLAVECDKQPNLTCTAPSDIVGGICTIHIVNNGATRAATLTGLSPGVKQLRVWISDAERGTQETGRIPVADGKAEFPLAATSYTTVTSSNP